MERRDVRMLVWLAAASAALLLVGAFAGTGTLFFFLPALLLGVPLVAGRYVGEERMVRRLGRSRRPRRLRVRANPSWRRPPVCSVPRGGGLIAWSLAVRPPPVLPAVH